MVETDENEGMIGVEPQGHDNENEHGQLVEAGEGDGQQLVQEIDEEHQQQLEEGIEGQETQELVEGDGTEEYVVEGEERHHDDELVHGEEGEEGTQQYIVTEGNQQYVMADGNEYVVTHGNEDFVDGEGNVQYVSADGTEQLVHQSENDPNAVTQEYGEEITGDTEAMEDEEDVVTQTIVDEHGNQQIVTGSAAAIQDLITLHGLDAVDAQGNIITARAPGEVDSADEDLGNVNIGMDQSAMDGSMMDAENMVEEVITGNNEDEGESFSLAAHEAMPSSSTDTTRPFLNVQEAIFNPATGTLQPISSINTPPPPRPAPKASKKKQTPQPVTKYVIQQSGGDGSQPQQQIILDAQALQGLLQGGGNTITFSGASGKQSIFLAPQSSTQSPQKVKTSKSPAKILPAPVPIGDQQQASTQRFLLKQGTVITPLSQGGTTKLIQMPSTGANQPIQYLRLVSKNQQSPSNKIPIAPATFKPKPVAPKPAPGQQHIFTMPSGSTADLNSLQNQQGLGNFVVLPNYMVKSEHNSPVPIRPAHDILQSGMSETAAILGGMSQHVSAQGNFESFRSLLEPNGMRPRKPCNCTKSQCLKLYCDCFANGEFCHLCNCTGCSNNLNHEEERQKAIKLVLERNPGAFRPKIGKSSQTGEAHERRHNKGCNCRRSGCLKNYCECYEAKIFCSGICKCTGCKNCIENIPSGLPNGVGVEQHFAGAGTSHRQTLKDLAEAAEVRVQQQTQVRNKMKAQMQEVSPQNNLGIMVPPVVFRYPHGTITYEVVTSIVEVILAKAEGIERQRLGDGELERAVLEEFGDCLSALMELGSTIGINNNFN